MLKRRIHKIFLHQYVEKIDWKHFKFKHLVRFISVRAQIKSV